jgi:uncharacterized membrane protein
LKISCGATAARSAVSVPAASFAARSAAAAMKPMCTSGLAIFCHAALVVTIASQASGASVTSA